MSGGGDLLAIFGGLPPIVREAIERVLADKGKSWSDLERALAESGRVPWVEVDQCLEQMFRQLHRDEKTEKSKKFDAVYEALIDRLSSFGVNSAYGQGDYWVVDDDYGDDVLRIHVFQPGFWSNEVLSAVDTTLRDFPGWRVDARAEMAIPSASDN